MECNQTEMVTLVLNLVNKSDICSIKQVVGGILKIIRDDSSSAKDLKDPIDQRLGEINKSMSTFRKDSEIIRFNANQNTGEKFKISDDFFNVMTVAKTVYELTGGAWDGTVKPLENLWGFGNSENRFRLSSEIFFSLMTDRDPFSH